MTGSVKLTMKVALEGNYYAERPDCCRQKSMVGLEEFAYKVVGFQGSGSFIMMPL